MNIPPVEMLYYFWSKPQYKLDILEKYFCQWTQQEMAVGHDRQEQMQEEKEQEK